MQALVQKHSLFAISIAGLLIVNAVGCGPDDDDDDDDDDDETTNVPPRIPPSPTGAPSYGAPPFEIPIEPAVTNFFKDFHASRYSQASSAAKALDEAATADPKNGPVSLIRLFSHLWILSEYQRDKAPDPAALAARRMGALELATIAKANNPTDPRADCLLGIQQVFAGRAIKNNDLLNLGYKNIDIGAKTWPQFGLFCRALADESLPATDPMFERALNDIWDSFKSCYGEEIDRSNPDITRYLGQATAVGANRACWNDWIAPHNAEGTYLYFGDLLVKQGKVATARIIYRNATLVKEFPQWPYKYLLEDRMRSDLNAKAKLYADGDPNNDPALGGASDGRYCAYCHAHSNEEP